MGSRKRFYIGPSYCTHYRYVQKPLNFIVEKTCKASEDRILYFELGIE